MHHPTTISAVHQCGGAILVIALIARIEINAINAGEFEIRPSAMGIDGDIVEINALNAGEYKPPLGIVMPSSCSLTIRSFLTSANANAALRLAIDPGPGYSTHRE
jgi:hypothetical protein